MPQAFAAWIVTTFAVSAPTALAISSALVATAVNIAISGLEVREHGRTWRARR